MKLKISEYNMMDIGMRCVIIKRGIIQTIEFMITHKDTAFLNYLILLIYLSPAVFVKRTSL